MHLNTIQVHSWIILGWVTYKFDVISDPLFQGYTESYNNVIKEYKRIIVALYTSKLGPDPFKGGAW